VTRSRSARLEHAPSCANAARRGACLEEHRRETGRVLFLYTPARAGGLLEEQHRTQRKFAEMSESELAEILQRNGWAIVGPSPL
jgi:hypothetical protein